MRPFKILDILFAYYIVIRGNLGGSAVECSSQRIGENNIYEKGFDVLTC